MYGGASLFSVTPCDLAIVEKTNKPHEPMGHLKYHEPDETDQHQEQVLDDEHPF